MYKLNLGNYSIKLPLKHRQVFGSCLLEVTPEMSNLTVSQLAELIAKKYDISQGEVEIVGINASVSYVNSKSIIS